MASGEPADLGDAVAFVRPRRAARGWRDVLADRTGPFVMTLATAATVGSLVVATAASASTTEPPTALQSRVTDQVSRSDTRVALVDEVPTEDSQVVAADITVVATRTMFAKDGLRVFSDPDTDSKKVGKVKAGAQVHATPETEGKFRMVEYRGRLAWVAESELSATKPVDAGAPAVTRQVPGGSVLGLKPVAMVVYRAVMARWDVPNVGGYRAHSLSVHQFGRAIDFMVYNDRTMGNAIADFLIAHAAEFKVDHIIYLQRIWTPSSPYWRHMADRGSPTANHMDHVHVAVRP